MQVLYTTIFAYPRAEVTPNSIYFILISISFKHLLSFWILKEKKKENNRIRNDGEEITEVKTYDKRIVNDAIQT